MIICPNCGSKSTEVNTTRPRKSIYIWRSRTCKDCGKTFSTREYTLTDLNALIDNDDLGQDLVADQVTEIVEDLIDG